MEYKYENPLNKSATQITLRVHTFSVRYTI